jgi:hypothetical protein
VRHHAFLIPGFFGFSSLGDVQYFRAVRETLTQDFAARGEELEIHGVRTFPTGSLVRRARRVIETIVESGALERGDAIHLIGHSTGGLDARLVGSTAEGLGYEAERRLIEKKLRSVVCLATPHYGTPLANFFTTIYGKKLLYFVTLLVFVGLWRRPISLAAGALGLGYRLYDLLGLNETMLRQITNQLLRDFTPEREREVRGFLNSILDDVSLMIQLTPEAMDVTRRSIVALPDVRVVSYGTVSPPPLRTIARARLRELLTPLPTVLYGTLYTLTASPEPGYAYHGPIAARGIDGLSLPFELDASSNDGVVPALSQIHGEFRGFVRGDHLDVVGHYERGPAEKRDGADWFTSGADFDVTRFDELWNDVTEVLLGGPVASRA